MQSEDSRPELLPHKGVFATTHWSVVLAAGGQESSAAAEALETLCRGYWYPLYVYVRRRGYGVEDAQDLTQQFFARVLEKGTFRRANPERGKFRTFLLHTLQNFLANEWNHAHAVKRGGRAVMFSMEVQEAEGRYAVEPATTLTPERAYDKRWALTLLEQVLTGLRQEYTQTGKARVFEELADLLWGKEAASSYARIGERLSMKETAVRGAMHRLRSRFRERLRTEVANTVVDFGQVDEELRELLTAAGQSDSPSATC